MTVIHPHSATEYNTIKAAQGKLVVVDFSATWCGPCKKIAPRFEALSNQYPDVSFVHIDVDKFRDHEDIKSVKGVPHFKFIKNGQLLEEFSGANEQRLGVLLSKYR